MPRLWSAYDDAILRRHYPDSLTEHVALYLGRPMRSVYYRANRLGIKKTKDWLKGLEGCFLRRCPEAGLQGRFKPGQAPSNKGIKHPPGWSPGRMRETQFKKGERRGKAAENWKPVGTIRADAEGFLRIKIREAKSGEASGFGNTKIWPLLNRYVWKQHFGPIPRGFKVAFRDGDRNNCAPDNLELVSNANMMRRNSVHNLPPELARIIQLAGVLNRKLRELDEAGSDNTL